MNRTFNVSADCKPEQHYMVDIRPKLEKIRAMIDPGQYFTINQICFSRNDLAGRYSDE